MVSRVMRKAAWGPVKGHISGGSVWCLSLLAAWDPLMMQAF